MSAGDKTVLQSVRPQYGVHYGLGWPFFSFESQDFLSLGIRWFENQWDTLEGDRLPSHTGVVTGEDEVIEAQASGVVRASLKWRFDHQHTVIWFRRPRFYCAEMGGQLIWGATQELGKHYNFAMIGAHALSGNLAGKAIDRLTRGWLSDKLTALADSKRADICSMVTGYALERSQMLMAMLGSDPGALALPPRRLKPSDLDNDGRIFAPRNATL